MAVVPRTAMTEVFCGGRVAGTPRPCSIDAGLNVLTRNVACGLTQHIGRSREAGNEIAADSLRGRVRAPDACAAAGRPDPRESWEPGGGASRVGDGSGNRTDFRSRSPAVGTFSAFAATSDIG